MVRELLLNKAGRDCGYVLYNTTLYLCLLRKYYNKVTQVCVLYNTSPALLGTVNTVNIAP